MKFRLSMFTGPESLVSIKQVLGPHILENCLILSDTLRHSNVTVIITCNFCFTSQILILLFYKIKLDKYFQLVPHLFMFSKN